MYYQISVNKGLFYISIISNHIYFKNKVFKYTLPGIVHFYPIILIESLALFKCREVLEILQLKEASAISAIKY